MKLLLYVFIAMAGLSSFGILLIRNVFHGALLLLMCLLAIAGLYVLLFAELLAVTQILVYAGGILVVIIFGIMLTTKLSGKPLVVTDNKWLAGVMVGVPVFYLLANFILQEKIEILTTKTPTNNKWSSINSIGIEIMTDYLLPFEIAGLLLLIALVGAAVIASFRKRENPKAS